MDIRGDLCLDFCITKYLGNPTGTISDSMIQFADESFSPSGMANMAWRE
jgi:hypothetical protein